MTRKPASSSARRKHQKANQITLCTNCRHKHIRCAGMKKVRTTSEIRFVAMSGRAGTASLADGRAEAMGQEAKNVDQKESIVMNGASERPERSLTPIFSESKLGMKKERNPCPIRTSRLPR